MTTNNDRTEIQLPEGENLDATEKANNLGIILTSIVVDAIALGIIYVNFKAFILFSFDNVIDYFLSLAGAAASVILTLIIMIRLIADVRLGVQRIYSGKRRR